MLDGADASVNEKEDVLGKPRPGFVLLFLNFRSRERGPWREGGRVSAGYSGFALFTLLLG